MIPYGKQDINQQDIEQVLDVLTSDFLTQGPKVPEFENAIAEYCQAEYAFAVNSATSALHLACLALELEKDEWLWTSPITFVASANCAKYCDANVDFVDIDLFTYNICPIELEKKLRQAKARGTLPKILVVVHFAGQSCDMQKISALASKYGFKITEDASHAIGAKYQQSPIGNGKFSDISVFSFHPVKIITTAEGGALVTNHQHLAEKIKLLRSHGITRDTEKMLNPSHGAWYYEQIGLGFNYRMTELQAALGISQIKRLDEFIVRRHQLALRYNDKLAELPIILPFQTEDSYSSFHLYVIRLQLDQLSLSHKEIFDALRNSGIGVNLHYIPVHIQPYYQQQGFKWGDFPNAEQYYQEAISLPLYHSMTELEQDTVITALHEILSRSI